MSDKYSTIQQHQPLRVPSDWDKQERMLIVQLDEIFDDIYRRFGRIKLSDLSKDFREDVEEMQEGVANAATKTELTTTESEIKAYAAQYTDGKLTAYSTTTQTASAISTAISNSLKDYSTTTQTASAISTYVSNALSSYSTTSQTASAISTYVTNALSSYSTTSQTASAISTYVSSALSSYSTTTQTASQISTAISNSLRDYSTTSQTATAISTAINSALGSYSTTTQTQNLISAAVGDCYGKQSGITITSSGVDVSGSKHINLDINSSNYVHINSNGIEVKGSRIKVNGTDAIWARDDIIIMNPNSSDTWRRTVSDIESHMSSKTDWVLIRPYYDTSISLSGKTGNGNTDSVIINEYTKSGSNVFGNSSDWYNYAIAITANNVSGTAYTSRTVKVFLSDRPFSFVSSQREQEAQAQAKLVLSWSGTISGNGTTSISMDSGHIAMNLCGDGGRIYYYVYGLGMGSNININAHTLTATTSATTRKVPCTVYYYH